VYAHADCRALVGAECACACVLVHVCDLYVCDVFVCDVFVCDVYVCDVYVCDVYVCDVYVCDVFVCERVHVYDEYHALKGINMRMCMTKRKRESVCDAHVCV